MALRACAGLFASLTIKFLYWFDLGPAPLPAK